MRKAVVLIVLAAVALPVVALAATSTSSPLSISDGRGVVVIQGRGTAIGRVERGTVTVTDRTPWDTSEPLTFNCDDELFHGVSTTCSGDKLRFRMIGGGWKIFIRGSGIDISAAVSKGSVALDGESRKPGVYSVEGVDCRTQAILCVPVPSEWTNIKLDQATP